MRGKDETARNPQVDVIEVTLVSGVLGDFRDGRKSVADQNVSMTPDAPVLRSRLLPKRARDAVLGGSSPSDFVSNGSSVETELKAPIAVTAQPAGTGRGQDAASATAPRETPTARLRSAAPVNLSPQHAAGLAMRSLAPSNPTCARSSSGVRADMYGAPGRGESAQSAIDRSLKQATRSFDYLRRRPPPHLERDSNGGYSYKGYVFRAKIRRDGQVAFVDRASTQVDRVHFLGDAVSYDLNDGKVKLADRVPARDTHIDRRARLEPSGFRDLNDAFVHGDNGVSQVPLFGTSGSYDLNDIIEHGLLGKALYAAEKRWFLEQTESLRSKLAEENSAKEQASARHALERELEHVLAAAEIEPPQKRQRVLSLWEGCGDDAEMIALRHIVEKFVRNRMPEKSKLGFSRNEIERFNRSRQNLPAFEPYISYFQTIEGDQNRPLTRPWESTRIRHWVVFRKSVVRYKYIQRGLHRDWADFRLNRFLRNTRFSCRDSVSYEDKSRPPRIEERRSICRGRYRSCQKPADPSSYQI